MASKLEHYSREWTSNGARSKARWSCPVAEMAAAEAALRFAVDPYDASLLCSAVHGDFRGGDIRSGDWVMGATYAPASQVLAQMPDQPFEIEFESSTEAFNLPGGFEFASDSTPLLDANLKPVVQVAKLRVVLSGKRNSLNLATFAGYAGKINSDEFGGASAGHLYFPGAPGKIQTTPAGGRCYSLRIPIFWLERDWREVMRPDGTWEKPTQVGVSPAKYLYDGVSFANLLTAGT